MTRWFKTCALGIVIALAVVAHPIAAQQIRIASMAPESSPWGVALNRLAAEWQRISNGRVRLQVYHNMVAGDEGDVIRKMRIGQLQAAVISSIGLNSISKEVTTISMPMLIQDNDELDYVFPKVRPIFDEAIRQNRMEVLAWSKGGWVRFFSRDPVYTPDDLRRARLGANVDDPNIVAALRAMGYQAVPVGLSETLTSLNSGLINAFYSSPIATAGYQWFAVAPYMLDLNFSPFLGAVIINERTWNQVPAALRPQLIAALNRQIDQLDRDVARLESDAIELMKRHGLNVLALTEEQRAAWDDELARGATSTVGSVFDRHTYETIRGLLDEFRR